MEELINLKPLPSSLSFFNPQHHHSLFPSLNSNHSLFLSQNSNLCKILSIYLHQIINFNWTWVRIPFFSWFSNWVTFTFSGAGKSHSLVLGEKVSRSWRRDWFGGDWTCERNKWTWSHWSSESVFIIEKMRDLIGCFTSTEDQKLLADQHLNSENGTWRWLEDNWLGH